MGFWPYGTETILLNALKHSLNFAYKYKGLSEIRSRAYYVLQLLRFSAILQ